MDNPQNLENTIESILFAAGIPVDISDITSKLSVTKKQVQTAIDNLIKTKYDEKSGIQLLVFNSKLQFSTNSAYSEEIAKILNPIRERQLTKATLETLSIIAYKQPVTRLEIEEVRGVSSDYAISVLLDHKLIEIVGRKETIGKPILFGTTDEFLKRFNLTEVSDLPSYEDLLATIKTLRTEDRDEKLYMQYDVPISQIIPDSEVDSTTQDAENTNNPTQNPEPEAPEYKHKKTTQSGEMIFKDTIDKSTL